MFLGDLGKSGAHAEGPTRHFFLHKSSMWAEHWQGLPQPWETGALGIHMIGRFPRLPECPWPREEGSTRLSPTGFSNLNISLLDCDSPLRLLARSLFFSLLVPERS